MPRTRKPRAGSMQFWPRVRARHSYARIRNWGIGKEAKPLGFAGYKVGMTHLLINDNRPHSLTKGTEIFCPVTIVECPPLKTASIRFYTNTLQGSKLVSELFAESLDKELERKIIIPKKKVKEEADGGRGYSQASQVTNFDFVRLLCCTQPRLTSIGKKKPEIFEVAIGGSKEQQLSYAKEKLGKEININEVFSEGQLLDIHSLTTGKGFQGPVRRFGVQLRQHKSEKSIRNPGSLGPWKSQGHVMWRTAHAGKMGYHLRTEFNKHVLKIGNKADEINVKGGFLDYGNVKSNYLVIKGSIAGPQKRIIRFTDAIRSKGSIQEPPQITYVSIESKQGK
ncbi:50S ribosomal protein L3 [Candidatus Woesearchaeota archaeon]|nr:50S ribosomal protein L3 [Candidatus Woesearchaeota archaeon]